MTQYLVSDAAKICGTSSLHTVPVPQCLLAKTASRPRSRRLPVPYADETNFEKCSEFFFVFFQKKKKTPFVSALSSQNASSQRKKGGMCLRVQEHPLQLARLLLLQPVWPAAAVPVLPLEAGAALLAVEAALATLDEGADRGGGGHRRLSIAVTVNRPASQTESTERCTITVLRWPNY